MHLFNQITTNLHTGYMKTKYIFNVPFIVSETIINPDGSRKKRRFCPLFKKQGICADKTNPFESVFYLKINRTDGFSYICIQHWINIINELNADFYFVCDNADLKKQILKRIKFKDINIKFIKSARWKLRNAVKNIATKTWRNATYAQMTAFLHAEENEVKSFYNIDADDTMFICEPQKAAQILIEAKNYADKNNIKAFSLDMHVSQFRNRHWTFGITYTNTDFNWMKLFNSNNDTQWQEMFKRNNCTQFNLDWFMTYLKLKYKNVIETFYVENFGFIHWATLVDSHIGYAIQKTSQNFIYYPLFELFNTGENLSKVRIPDSVIKLDVGLKGNEFYESGMYNVMNKIHAENVVNYFNSFDYTLDNNEKEILFKTKNEVKLLEQIFSVKNEISNNKTHKVIRLLGLKFKFNKKVKELKYNPWGIIIDTTMICNNSCSFCWRKNFPEYLNNINSEYKTKTMPFATYKKIIDDACQYKSITWLSLCGPMGEPMMNDRIEDFFEYAFKKNHFKRISINTNGLAIDKRNVARLLNSINEFSISVDSVEPNTYEKIHGHKNLNKVIDNIKTLVEYKKNHGCLAEIIVRFTENEYNKGQIDDFVKFFKEIGVDKVNYAHEHAFAGVNKNLNDDEGVKLCPHPDKLVNFDFLGNLTTCCVNWHLKPDFGNIKNHTIKQMWESKEKLKWNNEDRFHEIPCKDCCGVAEKLSGEERCKIIDLKMSE